MDQMTAQIELEVANQAEDSTPSLSPDQLTMIAGGQCITNSI
jgi:hypothetical protein